MADAYRNPELDLFWSNVEFTPSCWVWTGSIIGGGYGGWRLGDRIFTASRWIYEQLYGEILDGIEICHNCDNPPCVRPDHLFAATHAENMLDCKLKQRARSGRKQFERRVSKVLPEQILSRHRATTERPVERKFTTARITRIAELDRALLALQPRAGQPARRQTVKELRAAIRAGIVIVPEDASHE